MEAGKMKEDAISRSSTLEHIQRLDHLATLPDGDFVVRLSEVEDAIINGLPAQPRKPGSWVRWFEKVEEETSTAYIPRCKCSECLTQVDAHASRFMNYCPYCGTQMENGGNNG